MQLSRLFEIVYILLGRRHVTAKELADRFEVSTRTIYRDIEALSLAGVPVYSQPGSGGGIYISDAYVLNKSALTDEEQAQILLALKSLSATEHDGAGALLSRLGSLFSKDGDEWIEVDFSRWGYKPNDRRLLATLKDAIISRKRIAFEYYGAQGLHTSRLVCPVKLVYKGHAWYLQAFDESKQAYRTFKMFRMKAVAALQESFDRARLPAPPTIDEDSFPSVPMFPVVLRFAECAAFRVFDEFDEGQIEQMKDGGLIVHTLMENDAMALDYCLSLGGHVEVLAPECLRRRVAERLREMLARYDGT